MSAIGQVPITVKRELDGFILNRLQGALLTEALRLVGEGYVSPQDLDKTVQDGLGLRWSFIGPFATIELNAPGGVADYCARYAAFYRTLAANPPAAAVWDAANVQNVTHQLEPPGSPDERDARMVHNRKVSSGSPSRHFSMRIRVDGVRQVPPPRSYGLPALVSRRAP